MLVLTRKTKQQIQIGPNITITILQVKGQAVRVGIEAPREMNVLRTELARKVGGAASKDATVVAALEKFERENEISSRDNHEVNSGRTSTAVNGSLRCRAPRVDSAPLDSPYQATGPASFLVPRRRRLSLK
jgi:carbon storage regulator CsrA